MRDRRAVVWTRCGGDPLPMGELYLTPGEARFNYDPRFLGSGRPGLGRLYPPDLFGERSLVFPRRGRFDLHPPLQALVPPRDPHNVQRRMALAYLRQQGERPAPGFDEDWAIALLTGHGGIGHLDLFPDHAAAAAWYQAPKDERLFEAGGDFGFSLKEYLTWYDEEAARLLPFIGPTPSVGGMIPKLLVTIPAAGWDGRIGLPSRGPRRDRIDVVLKLEQTASYPGLLELEALALELHRRAGFATPRHWLARIGDLPVLAVERFDRDAAGRPLPLESLYSVMAGGTTDVTDNHSIPYDRIANAINHPRLEVVSDKRQARRHLLGRLLLALLSGNGDLHLENLSLRTQDGATHFSPVYDPTPMRAYSRHDLLAPMPFGGYGEGADLPAALGNFARALGLNRADLEEELDRLRPLLPDYRQAIAGLERLPEANKRHLIGVTEGVERRLLAGGAG
jgi:serine/threonine-protein kinase HipA